MQIFFWDITANMYLLDLELMKWEYFSDTIGNHNE